MGGGGFSMEPDNLLLDDYVLKQTGKDRPKVCFVPTASGDSLDYIKRFLTSFRELNCETSYLSVYKAPLGDLRKYVLEKDVIYVGGGNTRNLLALWKEWGLDQIFKEAYEAGVVLAGISAGSICWFEEGITDSIPGALTPLKCLGFLKGSNCPHFDGEAERRPAFYQMLKDGKISSGLAADDGAAFHFEDGTLASVVSSRPNAKGYKLEWNAAEKKVIEMALETKFLGK